jgi:hypothetical protein
LLRPGKLRKSVRERDVVGQRARPHCSSDSSDRLSCPTTHHPNTSTPLLLLLVS